MEEQSSSHSSCAFPIPNARILVGCPEPRTSRLKRMRACARSERGAMPERGLHPRLGKRAPVPQLLPELGPGDSCGESAIRRHRATPPARPCPEPPKAQATSVSYLASTGQTCDGERGTAGQLERRSHRPGCSGLAACTPESGNPGPESLSSGWSCLPPCTATGRQRRMQTRARVLRPSLSPQPRNPEATRFPRRGCSHARLSLCLLACTGF